MTTPTEREMPIMLRLPAAISREIGRIVIAHALIEWTLSGIIYSLLDIRPVQGRIAVREPRTTYRFGMVLDLAKERGVSIKVDTKVLGKALEQSRNRRDQLAHGVWCRDPETAQLFLRIASGSWMPPKTIGKIKRRIDPEAESFDAADARFAREQVEATLQLVLQLRDEIGAALVASPE